MSGNKAGGLKAAKTNKLRHGDGFYARIGAKGGRNGHTGGFYVNQALASTAGAKGGSISRRTECKRWWDEHRSEVKGMINDGYSHEYIADVLGVNRAKIYYAEKKYGV